MRKRWENVFLEADAKKKLMPRMKKTEEALNHRDLWGGFHLQWCQVRYTS